MSQCLTYRQTERGKKSHLTKLQQLQFRPLPQHGLKRPPKTPMTKPPKKMLLLQKKTTMEPTEVREPLEYVHYQDFGSTHKEVQMAIPVAISSATVMTWTTTVVGSSPICHISPCNLPGLEEHGVATTSIVDLTALSDAATKNRRKLQDMEGALLRTEHAYHAPSKDNAHQKAELKNQQAELKHKMVELQHQMRA